MAETAEFLELIAQLNDNCIGAIEACTKIGRETEDLSPENTRNLTRVVVTLETQNTAIRQMAERLMELQDLTDKARLFLQGKL